MYNSMLFVTLEILVVIVAPLLILYLTGRWPLRIVIPCLLVIPVLWYLTYSPYVLDGLSVAVGFFALHRGKLIRPFALGVAFMLLCLRPAFDVVCETVAFALGRRGDLYHIAQATGYPTVWLSMAILIGFSLFTIARVLGERASRDESAAT